MNDAPTVNLDAPVHALAGVGPTTAKKLADLGLARVRDLLDYLPRRYQHETEERPIDQLVEGQISSTRGEIVAVDYMRGASRGRFEASLEGDGGRLSLTWFGGAWLRGKLVPGKTVRVRGKVGLFRGIPQMVNPTWAEVDAQTPADDEATFRPIYPATGTLTSKAIEKAITSAVEACADQIDEWFDASLLRQRGLIARAAAVRQMHRPKNHAQAFNARRRFVFDELMLLQLGLQLARRARHGRLSAPIVRVDKLLDDRIRKRFPFSLTTAQDRAAFDIVRDMQSGEPMNRLLQGDVGSGKTAVALYAMLVAVANKLQAALLAPTEVLAEQHHLSLSRFMANSGVKVGLFTQRSKRAARTMLDELASGAIHLAVGTQALIQRDIDFANLGLIVIDEQHRFGVHQRAILKAKGLSPHYLVMTATPIPRTLAMSYFADFDVSTIDSLPPGRQPIETIWLRRDDAKLAHRRLIDEVKLGRQAFVVLPRIDNDEADDTASLVASFETLRTGPLASLRLAMLHGRMSSDEKNDIMTRFRAREIDVLLSTTVIEVGVDVPNATAMLIDSAEQFGLAQLHQLRGRVGRGEHKSLCILLSDAPTPDSVERMRVMTQTTDGFEIAEADLKLRGPGEFFGTRQSGLPELKVADLSQELEMLKVARDDAMAILERDPELREPGHRAIRDELLRRFGDRLGLGAIG
jgi:ATP-dependent DNA helicase RecG